MNGQNLTLIIFMVMSSIIFEPAHDKTNRLAWMPSEDSNVSGHPRSLIRVFALRS